MKVNPIETFSKPKFIIQYFLLFLAIFFLLWNYDGDPSILKRYGDYSDEGYWLQNPANRILHGTFITDDQTQGYFGAPLFNQIITLQFKLFGVSFTSARIISILVLFITAFVVHKILALKVDQPLIFTVGFLLLFDNKLYYQWSTPIPLEILFQALLLLFLIKEKLQGLKAMFLAITLCYLGIISKTTSVWLIGFIILIFVIDNREYLIRYKSVTRFILFLIASILPLILLNLLFSHIEHERFLKFSQLLKLNTNLNWLFLDNILNPIYYLKQLAAIFKYPNSFLLLLVPFSLPIWLKKHNIQSVKNLFLNRIYLILFLYILCYVFFLMIIGQFGYDRRQINLILPFFILCSFCIYNFSKKPLKQLDLAYISLLFVIILLIQFKQLYHEIYKQSNSMGLREITLHSTSELIIAKTIVFVLIALSIIMIFKYKINFLLYLFISLNIFFHSIFINTGHTLKDASIKIENIANTFNSKYITGVQAHHASVGTRVIPIWHLENWVGPPYWNENFELFSHNNSTIILTNQNLNERIGYFPLKNIPEEYNIKYSDTIYLYKNRFLRSYHDTILIHVVSYENPENISK